jgi:hypothetical protein
VLVWIQVRRTGSSGKSGKSATSGRGDRFRRRFQRLHQSSGEKKFRPGTDVMIFKIFSAKKLAFLTENKANFLKMIITLVFEKNAHFFAENCRKSQKIVIITGTDVVIFRIFSPEKFSESFFC